MGMNGIQSAQESAGQGGWGSLLTVSAGNPTQEPCLRPALSEGPTLGNTVMSQGNAVVIRVQRVGLNINFGWSCLHRAEEGKEARLREVREVEKTSTQIY